MAQRTEGEGTGAHARLAPSSADRWMRCAGSVAAELEYGDDETEWAAEGTVAHKILELCLKLGFDAADFYGTKHRQGEFTITVDDEMIEFLQPIIDEILDTPGEHFYENRVPLDLWLPGQFGTLDVGIMQIARNTIIIRDLKYGTGVPVRAEDNAQLRIYAAGFWRYYAKKFWPKDKKPKFVIIIDQPRNEAGGGRWEISYDELMDWMEDVAEAGERTYEKNAKRTPGAKQCAYCKARKDCKAFAAWNTEQWGARFEDYQGGEKKERDLPKLPDAMSLTAEERANIIRHAPVIKAWLNGLHLTHVNQYIAGKGGGGLKAVEGRHGIRKWKDPKAAERWLDETLPAHSEIYKPRELISPAGAEKVLGRKLAIEPPDPKRKLKRPPIVVGSLIEQPAGKPVLVPESDPRPPLKRYSESFSEFDDED